MKRIGPKLALACVGVLLAVSFLFAWRESREHAKGIYVHVIDVGQGECIVIESSDGNIMIDSGTDASERTLRAYLKSRGLTHFSYLILSHPHDDHIGSADMILREFDVERVLCADSNSTEAVWTTLYAELDAAVRRGTTEWVKPMQGTVCWVGEIRMEVLYLPVSENAGGNDDSLVLRIDYGEASGLLMGDAGIATENCLLAEYPAERLQVDLLKVGHHGAATSSSENFLDAVMPRMAIISAGAGNSFSHPHEEVLSRLRQRNIEIYRTDINGTLRYFCDGQTFTLKTPF